LEIRQGALIAMGTVVDSITFTSNSLSPTPGIWDRVWANNGGMAINYCNFRYAVYGVMSADTVRNSSFTFNKYGCYGANYVDSCNFISNTIWGVAAQYINNCNILHNQSGINNSSFIKNCLIDSNQTGVDTYFDYGVIDNCTINHNQTGISLSIDGYNTFKNCIIDSNTVVGIEINRNDSLTNCEIKFNGIGVDGLYADNSIISENIIENNTIGIKTGGATNTMYSNIIDYNATGFEIWSSGNFYCNRICNNTSYDLQVMSATSISIPNNYWCTTDSISTEAVIYDGYDDFSLGLVSFMPLDTLNCYLTGCNVHISATVTNATCDTCHNGSATAHVLNGIAPYSYSWFTSPIQTIQTATGLASGTYTVCITDGHGCTACNYNVFVDSTNCTGFAVNATATNETCSLCNDGTATATVTAGTPPFNYTWYTSPIQTTQTATGLPAGSYAVCVTDLYGCAACDTATVGIGSCSAYYTVTPDTAPHTYNLTNMASGTPPLTYDWNWGDGSPHDTAAYPSHTYATSGTYTICLSIIDSAGCTNSYCHGFYLLSPMSSNAVIVHVIPPVSTGIQVNTDRKLFSISPNPAKDYLTLHFAGGSSQSQIRIINLLGEIKYTSSIAGTETNLNISSLSQGIYFIEVSSGNKVSRERFVKE
jgi:PKD repeat protein